MKIVSKYISFVLRNETRRISNGDVFMKILLLIAAFIFACSKPAVNHSAAITESKKETRHSLQIRSGQNVLEAAAEYRKKQSESETESMISEADSIVMTKTLTDGTTETTKIYKPQSKKDKTMANNMEVTRKDTATAKTEVAEITKDSVDEKEYLSIAERMEQKSATGFWGGMKSGLLTLGFALLAFVAFKFWRRRK